MLYAALDAAWLQEQEEVEARQIDGRSSGSYDASLKKLFQVYFFKGKVCMDGLEILDHAHQLQASHLIRTHLELYCLEKMELIDLGTLVCAITVSQRTISSETVTNLKIFYET
jgi:hypothetical protein